MFFIDKSILSLQICRYSMGKLMIEVLKMVRKWDLTKKFARGPRFGRFENLPGGCTRRGGMVTLGID